jgi:hypothetical protein
MKVICINSYRFALPEGMSTKDIQSLAGFITSLTSVDCAYNWSNGDNMYYAGRGATVQLEDVELVPKAEAEAAEKRTRAEYTAKREAEKAAE